MLNEALSWYVIDTISTGSNIQVNPFFNQSRLPYYKFKSFHGVLIPLQLMSMRFFFVNGTGKRLLTKWWDITFILERRADLLRRLNFLIPKMSNTENSSESSHTLQRVRIILYDADFPTFRRPNFLQCLTIIATEKISFRKLIKTLRTVLNYFRYQSKAAITSLDIRCMLFKFSIKINFTGWITWTMFWCCFLESI